MRSITRKISTLLKDGLDPFEQGKHNFENGLMNAEALERLSTCMDCEHFVKEPISFLRVKDEVIPQLSEMMCNDCGCELPYKTRQNVKLCSKWQK